MTLCAINSGNATPLEHSNAVTRRDFLKSTTLAAGAYTGTDYLNLLRIDTSGNASSITLGSWNTSGDCYGGTYAAPTNAYVITNADQGTLVTWQLDTGTQGSTGQSKQSTYYIATTNGTSLASQNTMPKQITPVLQAQDGTFFGTSDQGGMVRFDQSGNIKWNVGDSPKIATADNGVVGVSGTTYDDNGIATGHFSSLPTESWTGNAYTDGPVNQVAASIVNVGGSFAAFVGGNASATGTATQSVAPDVQESIARIALSYVGSTQWLDTSSGNKCNIFVKAVLDQANANPPVSPKSGALRRLEYYLGLADTPAFPALAGDWANPNATLKCWKTVTVNPGNPPLGPGTLPPDISIPGDVIAEAINYRGNPPATGHVGIIAGPRQTVSADSAAPCFPPHSPAGIIDISDYGFRPTNWIDPNKDPLTGQACRKHGYEVNAVVKRFVCQ